jgi:hypothetical protein
LCLDQDKLVVVDGVVVQEVVDDGRSARDGNLAVAMVIQLYLYFV